MAVGNIENVVAIGNIIDELGGPESLVHGIPVGVDNLRVHISIAIKEHAKLPILVRDDLVIVGDAKGSIVAWPKALIIWPNQVIKLLL